MHDASEFRASAAKWLSKPGYSLLPCPDCGLPIRLMSVVPASVPGTDEITYWCGPCQQAITRQVARLSLGGVA
jgi:hypothetical protein